MVCVKKRAFGILIAPCGCHPTRRWSRLCTGKKMEMPYSEQLSMLMSEWV